MLPTQKACLSEAPRTIIFSRHAYDRVKTVAAGQTQRELQGSAPGYYDAEVGATVLLNEDGTIAAVTPIALGFAGPLQLNPALLMGAVIGGAMFGDNMSMISDTTIAATRTQGVRMKDKFLANGLIAAPAALVALFRRIGRAVSPLLLVRGGGDAESRNVARRETGEAQ